MLRQLEQKAYAWAPPVWKDLHEPARGLLWTSWSLWAAAWKPMLFTALEPGVLGA